ncbi:MBL fold metallo-hydrolase [Mycobacterium sp. ACS4331]|uniref:MBL fold metallo-hydrolase n=1 Tax=Mycobacterium sp. ACS4331 TaxID=1834121 RepID=UPI0007FF5F89|nr:MBL fold metallo-hydrolase [Mycobacterium sp. ACS4331]OBF16479.1 MBL fold metallo-hydrolase [Mycobacterium sp. ACS4331]
MRLKPGRPALTRYADMFTVPAAVPGSALAVTWLGVSSLLFDDGDSAVLTDGFFSRPSLARVGLRRIAPSTPRVDGCLARLSTPRLDAVLPVHSHYDHVLDSALVAERTGAVLVGGESTANVGRGHGLPDARIVVTTPGEPMTFGAFEVTLIESHHCPPDRYPGVISSPVRPPVKVGAYRCGEAWSTLITHAPSGRRCLVQGSAGFVAGALEGHRAEVAYLGLGQLGLQSTDYLRRYWAETVRAVGARTVIGIHWDDFFRPLSAPLRALPYAADDLDFTLRVLRDLAAHDGVALHLPTVWRREDPWS